MQLYKKQQYYFSVFNHSIFLKVEFELTGNVLMESTADTLESMYEHWVTFITGSTH